MKKSLQWLVLTKYGRLVLALILAVIFQVLSDRLNNDTLDWIGLIFFAYVIGFSIYAIVRAGINTFKKKK